MFETGITNFRIISRYVNSFLPLEVSSRAIDILEKTCLKEMIQSNSKKAILIILPNTNRAFLVIEDESVSIVGDLENPALGETEDGTKVILVPVVLGDNGIEFVRTYFKAGL